MRSLVSAALVLGLIAPSPALERLEPSEGCYFGVNIGEGDTIDRLSARLGITPAAYVRFFRFPLTPTIRSDLVGFLEQVRSAGGIARRSYKHGAPSELRRGNGIAVQPNWVRGKPCGRRRRGWSS